MKVKLAILGLVVVCLWGRPAKADTILVDIVATECTDCSAASLPIDFRAQVTVEPVTGSFINPAFSNYVFATNVLEVTGMSGTLNGSPLSLMPARFGDGSWLFPDLYLGALYFSSDGVSASMFWDGGTPTIAFETGYTSPLHYSATVSTPEPG